MKRFILHTIIFLSGLLVVALLLDTRIGREIRRNEGRINGRELIGREIFQARERAAEPGPAVETIYLGDSISRQLFPPGSEPSPRLRYVTTNQAISLAGQYYLLERALRACPNVRGVFFFYFPRSFNNDLPRWLSHDYYCGYFNSPGQIVETFQATHDCDLLAAHIGRWAFPNLLAANSASRPFTLLPPEPAHRADAGSFVPPPQDPEPLLSALTRLCRLNRPAPPPPANGEIPISTVTRYFLPKIRALCRQRGVTLRILSSPCSDADHYDDTDRLYDAPILYVAREKLLPDGIHFQDAYVDDARRFVTEAYRLTAAP